MSFFLIHKRPHNNSAKTVNQNHKEQSKVSMSQPMDNITHVNGLLLAICSFQYEGAMETAQIVQYLHANRNEVCTVHVMEAAACSGHLHLVQWLHENRTEGCSVNGMNDAAMNGHLHIVQWLHHNRTEGSSPERPIACHSMAS